MGLAHWLPLQMNYDGLRRLSGVTAGIVSKNYTYRDISETQTTTQVSLLNYPNIGSGLNFGYTYDSSGNIATYTAPDGEVITYTYDSQGQLLSAVGDSTYSYTYDAAGNILTANGHTYTYGDSDWKDLLTAFDNGEITYDASGNPTSYYNGTRWTMTWENGRQLISASTTSDTEDVTVTYVYDMNGLRVSKTVTVNTYEAHTHSYTKTTVAATCTTRGYTLYECECGDSFTSNLYPALGHTYDDAYDKTCNRCGYAGGIGGVVASGDTDMPVVGTENDTVATLSTTASNQILISAEVEQHDYVYASGKLLREVVTTTEDETSTTQILDFFYDSNGTPLALKTNDIIYYYVTNLQGDVIQLIDSTGTAVAAYEYDPYGNIVSQTGDLADLNPLRYRGYYYDAETGLYYVSSRYYDPEIGRWINADIPETLTADFENFAQYNLFAYCFNNPVNMSDETGTWPSWVKKAVAVVTIAAVVVAATAITVATCGAGSVAGVAMITATATLAAKATEVAVLQVKKGKSEGKSGSQIAKDTVESIYDNGSKIVGLTPVTKSAGIAFNHGLSAIVEKGFGGTQTLSATLKSTGGKVMPYAFVAIAWSHTIISAFSNDPVTRANARGYVLK